MTGILEITNAVATAIIVGMIAWKLLTCHESFSAIGRWGASLTAGAAVMAGAALAYPHTPFEGWAAVLMRVGFALVLIDWFCLLEKRAR